MKKYYVIGGQYCSYLTGTANTIREAKEIAEKNVAYGDNWAGGCANASPYPTYAKILGNRRGRGNLRRHGLHDFGLACARRVLTLHAA